MKSSFALGLLTCCLLLWARGAAGQPIFSVSANGSVNPQLCRGWPLIVEAALLHPQAYAEALQPMSIAGAGAVWSDAVTIQVRDAGGQLVTWPLQLYSATGPTLLLDKTTAGRLIWFVAPEHTSSWAEGIYELVGKVDTSHSPSNQLTWQGVLESVPVTVQVRSESATLSEPLLEQKQRLFAQYYGLRGDLESARQAAQQLLAASPTNLAGFTMAAVLNERIGRLNDSFAASTTGLAEFFQRYPAPAEPPVELLRSHRRAHRALLHGRLRPPAVRGNLLELAWEAMPNLTFRVQSSADLVEWIECSADITSATGEYSWSGPLTGGAQFFRLNR